MKKIVFCTALFLSLNLAASDNTWTQDTQGLSKENSNKVIEAYTKGKELPLNLSFKDDKIDKEPLGIEENILVIGASFNYSSTTETLENTKGTKEESYSTSSLRFLLGKDFTFWHEQYTQPARFYLVYALNYLSSDVSTSSITFGLRENMFFWPLYSSPKSILFPTLSFEMGSSTLKRGSLSIGGLTSEASAGLTYQRGNFEYFANLNYTSITWDYPLDGIVDNSSSIGLNIGLTYKFMYGDF